jgi:hypothetical protein
MRWLVTPAVLLMAIAASQATAQDAAPKGTRVAPGGTTRVYVMAAFDKQCQSLAKPVITVTAPPAKGQVSFREGQSIVVQSSLSGQCIGSRVTGTGIYYTAAASAAGPDTFSISATLATGEVATRTFWLNVQD